MFVPRGDEFCFSDQDFCPSNEQIITTGAWQRRASRLCRECLDCPSFTQCWEELNRLFDERLIPPPGVMAGIPIALSGKPHGKFVKEITQTYDFALRNSPVLPSDVFDRYLDLRLLLAKQQRAQELSPASDRG